MAAHSVESHEVGVCARDFEMGGLREPAERPQMGGAPVRGDARRGQGDSKQGLLPRLRCRSYRVDIGPDENPRAVSKTTLYLASSQSAGESLQSGDQAPLSPSDPVEHLHVRHLPQACMGV